MKLPKVLFVNPLSFDKPRRDGAYQIYAREHYYVGDVKYRVVDKLSEWISVEDRLPEVGIPVWCYCFEDYEQRARFCMTDHYEGEADAHIFRNDYDKYISVTHWMPLPAPPEDGE